MSWGSTLGIATEEVVAPLALEFREIYDLVPLDAPEVMIQAQIIATPQEPSIFIEDRNAPLENENWIRCRNKLASAEAVIAYPIKAHTCLKFSRDGIASNHFVLGIEKDKSESRVHIHRLAATFQEVPKFCTNALRIVVLPHKCDCPGVRF